MQECQALAHTHGPCSAHPQPLPRMCAATSLPPPCPHNCPSHCEQVRCKFNPMKHVCQDRVVVLLDDSIVRGASTCVEHGRRDRTCVRMNGNRVME